MTETPMFFSNGDSRLFGVLHRPAQQNPLRAFVFCHPFGEEKLWTHRVFVSFARLLAQQGWAVLRFDYRGYGDSDDNFESVSVDDHLTDIDCALAQIAVLLPSVQKTGLLGLRFGATLAALQASCRAVTGPLILWEPLVNGERYIQEALRSNLTTQLAVFGEIRETREQLVEQMKNGSSVNIDGYELTYPLFEQVAAINLLDKLPQAGGMLVVKIARGNRAGKDVQALVDKTGATLEFAEEEPFWREIKRFYAQADALFKVTLEWLEKRDD